MQIPTLLISGLHRVLMATSVLVTFEQTFHDDWDKYHTIDDSEPCAVPRMGTVRFHKAPESKI